MDREPSIKEFFIAIWEGFGDRMSGRFYFAFSTLVALVTGALAISLESFAGRVLTGLIAAIALLATVYCAWANERIKLRALQNPNRLSEIAAKQFLDLIKKADVLIAEATNTNSPDPNWGKRAKQWNLTVEALIEQHLPFTELVGYQSASPAIPENIPPQMAVNYLGGRRQKLRTMTMRLLPLSWGQR